MIVLKSQSFSPPEDKRNGKAVLVIHGWSGSPETMGPMSKLLQENGYFVLAPLLTGHGCDNPDAFGDAKMEQWLEDVEKAWTMLVKDFGYARENITVLGLSMGSLLALNLAKLHGIRSIVLMAPAIENRDWMINLTPFLGIFWKYWKKDKAPAVEISKGPVPDGLDDMIYKRYTWIRPAHQLLRMQKLVRKSLKNPEPWMYPDMESRRVLVQWARDDEAVPIKAPIVITEALMGKLFNTSLVETQLFEKGRHELTLFSEKARQNVIDFLAKL